MKGSRVRTYPVVVVEWDDASHHGAQGWMDMKDVKKLHAEGCPIISAGVEILRDKQGIVLATAISQRDNTQVGSVFRIPIPFLKKRTVVGKIKLEEVAWKEPML